MSLTNNQKILLNIIFPQSKYDETREKYVVPLEAYMSLNLTVKQLRMLENMCRKNNIELEKLPKQLKYADGERLLVEYNEIKARVLIETDVKKKEELISQQIEVRNAIVEGYMKMVYKIINKFYPDIEKEQDKEDIYNIGYMLLIEFVDKYDPSRNLSFDQFLKSYLYHRIILEVLRTNKKVNTKIQKELIRFKKLRSEYQHEDDYITVIQDITGYSVEKIEFLEILLNNTKDISLEELIELEQPSEEDIEEKLMDKTIKENLVSLIEFLSEEEKEIIKLHYGFYDNKPRTLDEIAKIMGYNNRERVRQIKEVALERLRLPIYNIHISSEATDSSLLENYLETARSVHDRKIIENYEVMLLTSLPVPLLSKLMEPLSDETRLVLGLYLGLSGKRFNVYEIKKATSLPYLKIKKMISAGLTDIKLQLNAKTNRAHGQDEYYKYLSQVYFKNAKKR